MILEDRKALLEAEKRIDRLAEGFVAAQVLFTACGNGLFSLLETPRSAAEVAVAAGWSPQATGRLLDALVALRLVTREGDGYLNAPIASSCLVPGGPGYQGNIIGHLRNVSRSFTGLEEVLRTGRGDGLYETALTGEDLRTYILAMDDISRHEPEEILRRVDLSSCRRLLDLGGGAATYSLAFLSSFPGMRAWIFDREEVAAIARERVAPTSVAERVVFLEGDILKDGIGGGYDCVFMSNLIHFFSPENNRLLLAKCREALVPGGLLVVKDYFVEEDRTAPPYALMFGLHMGVSTAEGNTYSLGELSSWTEDAGFAEGRAVPLNSKSRLWVAARR